MSNSIRVVEEEKGRESSVTRIRQLFQDSSIKNKVIIIVEGPTDVEIYKPLFLQTEVYIHTLSIRFHDYVLQSLYGDYSTKLISVKDADFCWVNGLTPTAPNMFITDAHDLETMMINSGALANLSAVYPGLLDNLDALALCGVLVDYSYMKWYNYNNHTKLAFDKLSTINLYETGLLSNCQLLFSEVCNHSPSHIALFDDFNSFRISHMCPDIMCITNGHDLMDCIYFEMQKKKCGNLSKRKVLKTFYSGYSIQLFKTTNLFSSIADWAINNNRNLFVAS